MAQYTNDDIKLTLSDLRSKIRNGKITLYFRDDANALRNAIASAFGIDKDAFNSENFNPQTMRRFAKLFAIPTRAESSFQYPSQDDVATALQSFINRRANPWSHFLGEQLKEGYKDAVLATEADPTASLIEAETNRDWRDAPAPSTGEAD